MAEEIAISFKCSRKKQTRKQPRNSFGLGSRYGTVTEMVTGMVTEIVTVTETVMETFSKKSYGNCKKTRSIDQCRVLHTEVL